MGGKPTSSRAGADQQANKHVLVAKARLFTPRTGARTLARTPPSMARTGCPVLSGQLRYPILTPGDYRAFYSPTAAAGGGESMLPRDRAVPGWGRAQRGGLHPPWERQTAYAVLASISRQGNRPSSQKLAQPLIELRVVTRHGGESRNVRVRFTGPRWRPIRKIATLVLAGLITDLITHLIR
jgi:hypothetical protein